MHIPLYWVNHILKTRKPISTSGTKVQPWLAPYAASKAGLDALVRCAAVELAPHRIRVNSVQPGYVPTEAMSSAASPALDRTLTRATPLGVVGTPADVGYAVEFLAGDEASWITGQTLGVDGGLNIPVLPSMASIAARIYGDDVVRSFALPELMAAAAEGE